ncbi:bifunctional adenosylcobinamide kinase/adenosylcobinamide-phosphate guanylyltransferase [Paludibacterium yongneupense]|uniref:bifunctional adenosylcobinamide kinase/adenosylcobinamide-phosphate guanylyltransferase n=1 Tax=Paludibacterium yongneupense TaxID=400061 RepID=UPI0003F5576E|nr:bifunctional adenosylcobinamide kinase/adenosylcobinamide-phosphate guanylyltransferase [Paludibacterium yongneupense]
MIHLVTGGARSGKSRWAEQQLLAHRGPVCYVATAEVFDAEFAARVDHHRARRPAQWQQVDAGRDLAGALQEHARADGLMLVDCLGMWLMRFFDRADVFDAEAFAAACTELTTTLPLLAGGIVLVTNEVGWGVVPAQQVTRRFVDELGRLNQTLAAVSDEVTLVACGLPLALKRVEGRR